MTCTFFLRNREDSRGRLLNPADMLGCIVQSQLMTVPLRDGSVRLHGIVVLNRRDTKRADRHLGCRQAGFHIAPTLLSGFAGVRVRIRVRRAAQEIECGGTSLVSRPH